MNPNQAVASTSKATGPPVKVPLTIDILARMKPSKIFPDALNRPESPVSAVGSSSSAVPPQIVSLAFDDTGEKCLTSGEDEGFVIWDAKKGRKVKNYWSKKYGVALARFTHKGNIIHASTKVDDTIRYHSPHDNTYLAYFRGHTGRVRSIHLNPHNDEFLSAGDDGTVRLWDLRSTKSQAIGQLSDLGGPTIAAFDNTGQVFAVGSWRQQIIYLYDRNTFDTEPFSHAPLIDVALARIAHPPPVPVFTSIAFSNDGQYILVGTNLEAHYLLDAFSLVIIRRLKGHSPLARSSGEEVCFTSDSKFVMSGSADGSICIWDITSEDLTNVAHHAETNATHPSQSRPAKDMTPSAVIRPGGDGETKAVSRCVRMNPRYGVMAVGGEELSLWLPTKDEDAKIDAGW